ncbi:ComF family protein [Kushneria indalinina]|uniref:ComF family protein n=1 Tax=Kushneria indalinina DSM 14324 TaxID=1122140 RepID=A0A3D9DYY2_9GAMM|nr:ComF family protein [Kushneria indalinina]REC96000.1 ComF family protein [Kushneria indalinina DSM 14324]
MKNGSGDIWRVKGRRLVETLDRTLAWTMPGYCSFCLAGTAGGRPWCDQCFRALAWHQSACPLCSEPRPASVPADMPCGHCLKQRPNFDDSWVPFLYEGEIAQLIQRFKFSADRRAGHILLQLMLQALREYHGQVQAIVTADLHPRRARERGFDQTLWLGKRIAAALDLPLYRATRLRLTPTQRGLSRRARQRNVHRVYRVMSPLPASVLLFDDVMTTGATLEALSRACREQGAAHVTAGALARTPAGRAI